MEQKWFRDMDLPNVGTNLEDCLPYRKDRTRAYIEGYREFCALAVPVEINGALWYSHPNVNMYWDVSAICNASCKFCICKTTFEREATNYNFVKAAAKAIQITEPFSPSIQIVGGEPTISPHLDRLLELVNNSHLKRPVLGTNGWGLDRYKEQLNQSKIAHVNVSRHHWNASMNQEIMQFAREYSNDRFWGGLEGLRSEIRLQCNLIGGYIDSYASVIRFIEWARDHGIKSIAFAQLTPLPTNDIYQQSIIDYVSERQVDIDSILNTITNDPNWKFLKYRGGVACYYEIWTYYDITVVFKFSDNYFLWLADQTPRLIPDLILHTNGKLCGSWNPELKILGQL